MGGESRYLVSDSFGGGDGNIAQDSFVNVEVIGQF
jgi:hypothetical protein